MAAIDLINSIGQGGQAGKQARGAFVSTQQTFQDALSTTLQEQLNTAGRQANILTANLQQTLDSLSLAATQNSDTSTINVSNIGALADQIGYKGVWDALVTYAIGDVVTYEGSVYFSTGVNTGTLPTTPNLWINLRGASGTQGPKGPDGDPGEVVPPNGVVDGSGVAGSYTKSGPVLTCNLDYQGSLSPFTYGELQTTATTLVNADGSYTSTKWFALVVKADGTAWACGDNTFGPLGQGNTTDTNVFVTTGITDVKMVAAYDRSGYILRNNGELYSSGRNHVGQLGLGDLNNRDVYTLVASNISCISAGNGTLYAVDLDGQLFACGQNIYGQLGIGTLNTIDPYADFRHTLTPCSSNAVTVDAPATPVYGITKIVANTGDGAMLLHQDGLVRCVGKNNYGRMGIGDQVSGVVGVSTWLGNYWIQNTGQPAVDIALTEDACYIVDNGIIKVSGKPDAWAGVESHYFHNTNEIGSQVSASANNTLVVTASNGTLRGVGDNTILGIGVGVSTSLTPLTAGYVTGIDTSGASGAFIKSDGFLGVVGENTKGQLGLGSNTDTTSISDLAITPPVGAGELAGRITDAADLI